MVPVELADEEDIARGTPTDRAISYWPSVLATFLCFPIGILAVADTVRARKQWIDGRYHDSRVTAEAARRWALRGVIVFATLIILALILGILLANDHAVVTDFLLPSQVFKTMPLELRGFRLNIELFLVGEVTVLAWAMALALLRSLPGTVARPVRFLATVYVDVFRGLPSLLVILVVTYGIERTNLPILSQLSDFESIVLALTLVYGAYVGEVIKGGMDSIHWSQTAAARSLGLSYLQTMRYVVVPQAVRNIIPPLLNAFISLQKDTSLVSIIGLLDAVNYAQVQALQNANLSAFTGVGICFLVVTVPLTRLADALMARDRRRVQAGG
jgi:polar amino acid transport system permease protein